MTHLDDIRKLLDDREAVIEGLRSAIATLEARLEEAFPIPGIVASIPDLLSVQAIGEDETVQEWLELKDRLEDLQCERREPNGPPETSDEEEGAASAAT